MDSVAQIPGPLSVAQLREFQDIDQVGVLPANSTTKALTNRLQVKAEQGKLYGVTVTNTNAAAQFVQLFDSAGTPADGLVPLLAFNVSGASVAGLYFGSVGRAFEQGIFICNSTTQGTKTIGANDCLFDAQFI